jgi:hypothetical protein
MILTTEGVPKGVAAAFQLVKFADVFAPSPV